MKVFILLALALSAVSAEFLQQEHPKDFPRSTKIEGRITNGYPAYEGKAPYTVGLSFNGQWWCGGSIIAHDWVLTAAHCANGAGSVTIYYGATWRTNAQFTHHVGSGEFRQNHIDIFI